MAEVCSRKHYSRVLDHDSLREEMIRQLDSGAIKGVDIAKHLGIAAPRVNEMRNRTRRVQQHEMGPLADLLGLRPKPIPTLMLPVSLPNEDALTVMMQGLLLGEDLADSAGERARRLARRLPDALAQIAGQLTLDPSAASTSLAERARPPATPRHD